MLSWSRVRPSGVSVNEVVKRPAGTTLVLRRLTMAARLAWNDVRGIRWRLALTSLLLAPLPGMTFGWLRASIYRRVGGLDVDVNSTILGKLVLAGAGDIRSNLHVGTECVLTTPLYLNLSGRVSIGDRVVIGHHVVIITDSHDTSDPACRGGQRGALPVRVDDGAWICARATILPGVTVGRGAVVAAGAVVSRDVPPNTVVAGVPARPVKQLSGQLPPAFQRSFAPPGESGLRDPVKPSDG